MPLTPATNKILNDETFAKMKKVQFSNMDPKRVRFMAKEIIILQRLDHPNVVKHLCIVTSRMLSSLYLVFEYMDHDPARLAATPGIKFTEQHIKYLGGNSTYHYDKSVPDFNALKFEKVKAEITKQYDDRYKMLEDKVKVMEVTYEYGMDSNNLSLVSNLVLPLKLKAPKFEKYDETSCPYS
ncbi:serine/threonine-protein kinase bur1-like [Hibiscus syriacus]|uniref:serine/threonine-protein kinase bur1-like n=1 Tax=Hibiscus syriacus TaxID=106335 RepID=UPI001920FAA7|nr:serine/threonine-protein kinase bur1-like [Hibiscus syriacus]